MIVRSEFSFRTCFGPVKEVVARLPPWGGVIADDGTWGHVPFAEECAKQGKHAVLGCRFVHNDRPLIVVPKTPAGLRALYAAVAAGDPVAGRAPDEDWAILVFGRAGIPGERLTYAPGVNSVAGPRGVGAAGQGAGAAPTAGRAGVGFQCATSDNLFPAPVDKQAWLLMLGRRARQRAGPGHILTPEELVLEGATPEMIRATRELIESCDTPVPKAQNVKYPVADPQRELEAICRAELRQRCIEGVSSAGIPAYAARLDHELKLIAEKKFADYFLVIWDMIRYAKTQMLVGPARGSSAGSLVCWLTRITEIDPIAHGLLFERFIDVNRMDLPDIDIDFPDERRHLVVEYLRQKYGEQNVANIGTVIRYKPKSALTDVAKQARIPLWELDKLKDVMIERSSGDSRASNCLADSLEGMEVGKQLVEKYPLLKVAVRLEDHARSAGVHAAGIIVCNEPVSHFCGVTEEGIAQVDKKMAESINALKIDALGLRTLSIIEEACELARLAPQSMYSIPLEEPDVFAIFNARKFSGIFQYEGIALQSVAKQIVIDSFNDVAAITALARPGPLSGGETTRWIIGKNTGKSEPLHPALAPFTAETFGTILYQEQVMSAVRELGNFSWADTSHIRKIMSGRKGNEAFAKFEVQFAEGAATHGIARNDAIKIWKAINTMGSWAFNKSHAVAYGLVSYWTAWLKAHHPLEFAVANLRHAKDPESALAFVRELHREQSAVKFVACDPLRSTERWEFGNGELLGPLTGLPGIGLKIARDIQVRRTNGIALTARQQKLLAGESVYKNHSPTHALWHEWYEHPEDHFQRHVERVWEIEELDGIDRTVQFVVIGRLIKKNLRDLNEEKYLVRRGGRKVEDSKRFMLLFHIEDDTGRLLCCINAQHYRKWGVPIVEQAAIGTWFALLGTIPSDFKMMQVQQVKWLTGALKNGGTNTGEVRGAGDEKSVGVAGQTR